MSGRTVLSILDRFPADADYVGPGERRIYACVDPPPAAVAAGRALAIPPRDFDVRELWARLPSGFAPDLVTISSTLARAPGRPTPLGVGGLPCPAVMKLTDSHHARHPIRTLIQYARRVGCGHHWTTYNRQHLHFFVEAGLPGAFWVPGAVSMAPCTVPPAAERTPTVAFCGSVDRLHPYRGRLLEGLRRAGVPVRLGRHAGERLPWADYLRRFAEATVVFNCSLNGDLGKRVFEVLMAGGFLLTDRLAPESGLPRLFEEGVHLECYGSEAELLDKARHYLAHPEQAAAIARRGQAELLARYHPYDLLEALYGIVEGSRPVPALFRGDDDPRVGRGPVGGAGEAALRSRLDCYELLQELHRLNPEVRVLVLGGEGAPDREDWVDLPRLRIARGAPAPSEIFDVALVDAARVLDAGRLALDVGRRALAPGAVVVVRGVRPPSRAGVAAACRAAGLAEWPLAGSDGDTCLVYRPAEAVGGWGAAGLALPGARPPGVLGRLGRLVRAARGGPGARRGART